MDGPRFDHFAKTLVTRADRRRMLQGLSGAVSAVLGTTLVQETTTARWGAGSRGGGKPKRRCAAGLICCGEGQTNCRGQCVDLQEDRTNCGVCGQQCGAQEC